MYSNLRTEFKILVEKTINELSSQNREQIDIGLIADSITNWPEFSQVDSEIQNYREITCHFNCHVGANYFRSFSGPQYIQNFVYWCTHDAIEFNERDFELKFESFVSFFTTTVIDFIKECNLYNFKTTSEEINLNPEITIKQIQTDNKKSLNENGYELFSDWGYMMVQKGQYTKQLIPQGELNKDSCKVQDDIDRSCIENFDRTIAAIRVLKASACYRDHRINTKYLGFFWILGESSNTDFFPRTSVGNTSEFNEEELEGIKTIWDQLKNTDNLGLLSSRRLSYVSERRDIEDKLIDCFVGLEALYLPDGNAELTFRLSLRIAKMLTENDCSERDLFDFIKEMYNKRSKVSHGKNVEISQEELSKLENMLRSSIKKYLLNKEQFDEQKLNDLLLN